MAEKHAQPSVLIIGGTGFIGHHLANHFLTLTNPTYTAVHILSRSAPTPKFHIKGVQYHSGSLTDHAFIAQLLTTLSPTLIIHAATPSPVTGTKEQYEQVNMHGTFNLLKHAKANPKTRALIYTSSSTLSKGHQHVNLTEEAPLSHHDTTAPPYIQSKSFADMMVLRTNYPKDDSETDSWEGHLSTASIRLPLIYGTHDPHSIPNNLNSLRKGQTSTTIGPGTNLWSFCSIPNAMTAHALVATALLSAPPSTSATHQIAGQAFNINDGTPHPFWSFSILCWKYAAPNRSSLPSSPLQMSHLPIWFMLALATVIEYLAWFFTLGSVRPYTLSRWQVEYMCFEHTYSIDKARERLGFAPEENGFEDELRKGVEWCLDQGGWRKKLVKVKGVKQD